jgi:hypothetical protein
MSWFCPEFYRDTSIHTELYQHFLPVQPPLYGTTILLCFLTITSYIFNSLFMISTNTNELISIFLYCFTQTFPLCLRLPSSIFPAACFWIPQQSADCTNRLYCNHLHKTEPFQCCTHFSASHSNGRCNSQCLWHCHWKFNQIILKQFRSLLRSVTSYLNR